MINPASEILITPSTSVQSADVIVQTSTDIQSSTKAVNVQPLTTVPSSTSATADVQPSTSAAADVQPSTSAAAGTVVILDFGKTKLPKQTYTEFHDIFQAEQPSLEIDVYQVAVEFSDKTKRLVDKKEIKKHSSAWFKIYFDKINQLNPEIEPDELQLS